MSTSAADPAPSRSHQAAQAAAINDRASGLPTGSRWRNPSGDKKVYINKEKNSKTLTLKQCRCADYKREMKNNEILPETHSFLVSRRRGEIMTPF